MAGLGGVIGTLLGWMGYQIGQRTDTANANGSLHSRVAHLEETIYPWHKKDVQYLSGSTQDAGALITVVGPGWFFGGYIDVPDISQTGTIKAEVYIDGKLLWHSGYLARGENTQLSMFCRFKNKLEIKTSINGYAPVLHFTGIVMLD